MKILINGREMTERMNDLEQREQHYFEIIKKAAIFIAGALLIICLPNVVHAVTDLLAHYGQNVIDAYQSIR